MKQQKMECEILVIGSGPGGATTACLLAEAGHDVILAEEGGNYRLDSAEAYSLDEIAQKYRNGGLTPSFGKTKVTYIEGRCTGGGSEINAALCHFPPDKTLKEWADTYKLKDFGPEELEPYFREIRQELSVSSIPYGLDPASKKVKEGSDALGWASEEVLRFWHYPEGASLENKGTRQSMTETLVPRAIKAGCRLKADTWVKRLSIDGGRATSATARSVDEEGNPVELGISFRHVVVCGGPTQTPILLQRSGLRGNVGKGFTLHPMIRAVVRFEEAINDHTFGVPVQQVVQFKPEITLGCSHSSLPHLVMWLGGEIEDRDRKLAEWEKMTMFYVLVKGNARGKVVNVPGFDEAFVSYPLNDRDLEKLGEGLYLLGKLLFTAGAVEIFSPITDRPPITKLEQLEQYKKGLSHRKMTVSTIHIFSSCPMGEDPGSAVVDSYGRMHGFENIWINDASILPDATGVNPQATVMAVARRNTRKIHEVSSK